MYALVGQLDAMTVLAVTLALLIMWPLLVATVIKALRLMTGR